MMKVRQDAPVDLARHALHIARERVRALKMIDPAPSKERISELMGLMQKLALDLGEVCEWHYGNDVHVQCPDAVERGGVLVDDCSMPNPSSGSGSDTGTAG